MGETPPPEATGGVHAAWPDRTAVPHHLWADLLATATAGLDALGELATLVLDDHDLRWLLIDRINAGVLVRLFLTSDGADLPRARELATSIATPTPRLCARRLTVDLPVGMLRADDGVLVSHYLPGAHAVRTPTYYVRRSPASRGCGDRAGREDPSTVVPNSNREGSSTVRSLGSEPPADLFSGYLDVAETARELSTPVLPPARPDA